MSNSDSIRKQVIAGLIVTAIVAIITWSRGYLSAVFHSVRASVFWFWDFLMAPVSVPTGVLIVTVVWLMFKLLRRINSKRVVMTLRREPTLGTLASSILRALAAQDGTPVKPDEFAYHLNEKRLLIHAALEELESEDLIVISDETIRGPLVHLTVHGRNYLIRHGLI